MKLHHFIIHGGVGLGKLTVDMDGRRLAGVSDVRVELGTDRFPEVTIVFASDSVDVEVEGLDGEQNQ